MDRLKSLISYHRGRVKSMDNAITNQLEIKQWLEKSGCGSNNKLKQARYELNKLIKRRGRYQDTVDVLEDLLKLKEDESNNISICPVEDKMIFDKKEAVKKSLSTYSNVGILTKKAIRHGIYDLIHIAIDELNTDGNKFDWTKWA